MTVTLTQARTDSLRALAAEVLPDRIQKFFLFASREHFSIDEPHPIYSAIYSTPKNDKPTSLAPA